MGKAERCLTEYVQHQQVQIGNQGKWDNHWEPPRSADFKVNVDTACFEGHGSGFGIVIRDKKKNLCFISVRRSQTQWSPEMAECLAIGWGWIWQWRMVLVGVKWRRTAWELFICCIERKWR
ncbi:unnamed protein product [Linum trigynum]|uniref:RNase H type-1 domain-containing protein n=1 Tax=Linum trigynum TaxID=586398 RepID=A0AAV2F7C5_9ROSI